MWMRQLYKKTNHGATVLFYTGLGIPVAKLADRFSRTWIMTAALVIWSGMTAVSGFKEPPRQQYFYLLLVWLELAWGRMPLASCPIYW